MVVLAEISVVVEAFGAGAPADGDGLAFEQEGRSAFEGDFGFWEAGGVSRRLLVRKRRACGDGCPLLLAEQRREDEIGASDAVNFIEELQWFDGGECCCDR